MRLFAAFACALAFTIIGFAQPTKQIVGHPNPNLPFSPAVRAGGFVYVSGAAGPGAGGTIAKGDVKAQTRQVLENIDATLKAGGSSLANAASITIYLRNASDYAAMNEVYATFFKGNPPARTTVATTQPLANPDALLEVAAIGVPNGAERTVIRPSGWSNSPLPYSYGIKSGDTLFMAGLVSRNGKDNSLVKGDIAAQTRTVLDNARAVLAAADMSLADIVSSRVYLANTSDFQAMNAAYRPAFTSDAPPRATVQMNLPSPDYLIEATFTAVTGANRKAYTTPNADGSAGRANPNFRSGIAVGDRMFLAGTTGTMPGMTMDVKAQTTELVARAERTLKAGGFDPSNVVDAVVYLADMKSYQDMNAAYRAAFGKDFPARATVGAGLMGAGSGVEIMFTAVK